MSNQIQVKRSTTTRQPPALQFGEFGYTTNGSILWIGQEAANTANVIAVGGARVPGVLTANQAIVVDGSKMIDTIMVGNSTVNAVVNSTSVKVSNSTSNSTFTIPSAADWAGNKFLHANGTWATPAGGIAGSNTYVQFNDSGTAGGTAGFTFDKTTNNLVVGNTLSVPILGANVTFVGNSSVTAATVTGNSTVTEVKVSSSVANVQSATITLAGTTTTITSNLAVTDTTVTVTSNTQNFKANSTVTGLSVVGNTTATVVTLGSGASVVNVVSTNTFVTSTNVNIAATGTTVTGTNLTVGANATFNANVVIAGDLIVNGTTFTVNVDTISVEDSIIKLASNNLTTNTIDIGLYGVYGNSTVTAFSGIFRDTSNAGVWTVFKDLTAEPGTTVDTSNNTFARGAVLADFVTEVFSANSTKVSITAGSLFSDLSVADGGTGASLFANNGVIYGQNAAALAVTAAGTDGQVLQAGATGIPSFGHLDGGTF